MFSYESDNFLAVIRWKHTFLRRFFPEPLSFLKDQRLADIVIMNVEVCI